MPLEHAKLPRAWNLHTMRLGHHMGCTHMRPMHFPCAPYIQKCGAHTSFPASVLDKARAFCPNRGRNSHYK